MQLHLLACTNDAAGIAAQTDIIRNSTVWPHPLLSLANRAMPQPARRAVTRPHPKRKGRRRTSRAGRRRRRRGQGQHGAPPLQLALSVQQQQLALGPAPAASPAAAGRGMRAPMAHLLSLVPAKRSAGGTMLTTF